MTIMDKRAKHKTTDTFRSIPEGVFFLWNEVLYRKSFTSECSTSNSVTQLYGTGSFFNGDEQVTPVQCELTIIGNLKIAL